MNITPWRVKESWLEPFDSLEDVQREMNRLFNLSSLRPGNGGKKETWNAPAVDIHDEKDRIIVKADIPGMTKEQIQVEMHDNVLSIKGEKKEEKESKEKDVVRKERFYGSFHRSFSLPAGVDAKGIAAAYKDGVLEIILPKKEEAKPKQIKVDVK